ncbi:MAG: hypothetical protein KDJ65_26625 [Anaerolineae bacterium]|nr:hypothetical protein [Anaerolineae bacterium]
MTLAIALTTNGSRFGLAVTLAEPPLLVITLALLCSILAGMVIDFAFGLAIGTITLWPAGISLGALLGLLIIELLETGNHEQQESNCS